MQTFVHENPMITSHDFNGPEIDDFHHRDVFTATVPGNLLTGFGESIGLYDELCIHWLPTRDYPKPDDFRLNEILPTFAEISAGIIHALEAYAVEWNVDWISDAIRESLPEDQWKLFLQKGYAPFVAVDRIHINPTARVISCRCDCTIDPNIDEHGLIVVMIDGEWIAKWSTDDSMYFFDWNEDQVQ